MACDREKPSEVLEEADESRIELTATSDGKVVLHLSMEEHAISSEMSPKFARTLAAGLCQAADAAERGRVES